VQDESKVSGAGKKTILYDQEKGTVTSSNGELKDKTSDKAENINEYNRQEFKYNKLIPQITGSFNPDDGIFIGGGFTSINHKFRKNPFGSRHTLSFAIAPRSASFNFKYKAEYTDAIGNLDFLYEVDVFEPSFADFFYGFGNRTMLDEDARDEDSQYYRARYGQLFFKPALRSVSKNERHTFTFGGYYRSVLIDEEDNDPEENRFLNNYIEEIDRGEGAEDKLIDERRNYAALTLDYQFDTRDARFLPTKGVVWNAGGRLVSQFGDEENSYQNLKSDFSTFFSFGGALKTTLALRVGGEANFGGFEFYQAPRLGGLNTLRGYRRTRFAGDQSFYQNTDVRIKLLEYRTPLFPGSLGITLIHDIGRVWTEQEDGFLRDGEKEEWHRGIGGGIWIAPLGQAVISFDYTVSNDDETGIFVRFGFLF
ncbi:MAG: BamA/TamA family outer membrane protein, partial [Bacteroidota bacterium]